MRRAMNRFEHFVLDLCNSFAVYIDHDHELVNTHKF